MKRLVFLGKTIIPLLCLGIFFLPGNLFAADRYWVGGSGTWNSSSTSNWAASSGGATGASVPTSADNVFFDANSFTAGSKTVTLSGTTNCANMDWTGATNTPTFAGTGTCNIFGSSTFIAAMTLSATATFEYEATSTGFTVTSAGLQFQGIVTFQGAGGGWTLQDAISTTSTLKLLGGTFATANFAVTCQALDCSGSTTRTVTLGSSAVTINGSSFSTIFDLDGSNLTFTAGTSTITCSFSSNAYYRLDFNGKTLYNLTFPSGDYELLTSGSCTYNNLTLAAGNQYLLTAGTTHTISGTFSADGACSTYIVLMSRTSGTQATMSFGSAQAVDNLIVQDIAASTNTLTCDFCVNTVNNTGTWSFTNTRTSRNLYWISQSGNFSDVTQWSTTSGGANDVTCSPNPLDNVYFDASSFNGASQTVTMDKNHVFFNHMDWTGVTNTPTLDDNVAMHMYVYGNIKFLASGSMTTSLQYTNTHFESSTNPTTVNTQGQALGGSSYHTYFNRGGTYFLTTALNIDGDLNIAASTTLDVLPSGGVAGTDEKNLNVYGSWENSGTFNEGSNTSAWVTLDGVGSMNVGGASETFYNLKVNTANTSTGHYAYNNITVTNNFTMTAGLFQWQPSASRTFACSNACVIDGGTFLHSTSNAIFTAANDVDLNGGTFEMDAGTATITGNWDIDGGKVQMDGGTMTINGTGGIDGVDIAGTGEFEVNAGTVNVGNGTTEVLTIAGTGVLDFNAGTMTVKGNVSMSAGTFDIASGTINVSSAATSGTQLSFTGGTYNFTGGTIDIKNTTTGGAGTCLNITSGAAGGTISGGAIKISATNANGKINVASTRTIYSLEIAATGMTIDLEDALDMDGSFTLTSGTFDTDAFNMTVGGSWTYTAGTFTHDNNTVTFNGSAAQTIAGASATTFHDVTISNTSGGVALSVNATINGTITMSSGDLTIATTKTLTIDDTDDPGISGGSTSTMIVTSGTATIQKTYTSTTPITFPLGNGTVYRPLTLTPAGIGSTVWTVSYTRSAHADADVDGSGLDHISRAEYWTCDRSGGSPENATMALTWFSDGTVTDYTKLAIAHYDGTTDWDKIASTPVGTNSSGTITSNAAVSTFSPFTLASTTTANPLPIQLLSFDAVKSNQDVNLIWETASEVNNDYFTVERSADGQEFYDIGTVEGAGNSNNLLQYNLFDYSPLHGSSYYRLKQTDYDGQYSYSEIRQVNFENKEKTINVYPNPNSGQSLTVSFLNADNENSVARIDVVNLLGEKVYSNLVSGKSSQAHLVFNNQLAPGVYTIVTTINDRVNNSKFIVK